MRMVKTSAICVVAAAVLAACGGGGGSGGESHAQYKISLRADKNSLPLNVNGVNVGIGAYSPFSTLVYVNATENGLPIPGGENIFACNIAGGLDTGSLYYVDNNEDHMQEVDDGNGGKIKVKKAYRSITLGANSGGDSFLLHAGHTAGTVRVVCSVTDPRDKKSYSASVDVVVGAPTGKASNIQLLAQRPVLGTQGNQGGIATSAAINAQIFDDANQPVSANGKPNLQVAIVPGGASVGARLLSANRDGSSIQVETKNGVGLFSLSSGSQEGNVLLELTADRFDNDVSNGIQDPIRRFATVAVIKQYAGPAPAPLEFVAIAPPDVVNGLTYSYSLLVAGGTPPYTWTALGQLPQGLTLTSGGLLFGTPRVERPGTIHVAIQVSDAQGQKLVSNVALGVSPIPGADPGLGGTQTLAFVDATPPTMFNNQVYSYALTAKGGKAPYTWSAAGSGLPNGLSLSAAGIISGTPNVLRPGSFPVAITVTDAENKTATTNITLTVEATPGGDNGPSPLMLVDITPPEATRGLPYSYSLRAAGGSGQYTWTVLAGSSPGTALLPGVQLQRDGLITGTPTAAGDFAVAVRLTDSDQRTLTGNFTIKVKVPEN